MTTSAVSIEDVSKRFRLYHAKYSSLKEKLIHAGRVPYDDLWALREVSFDVAEGETVGILGRNGSGKSTLLKCVCGVLQPTSGQVVVRGKLAGLLELGAGFQQDLSGRENIYLNGSMLGLSKREVDRVFDDIVEFSELGNFIDNQVKFYSSGMYVRLGFAVAVNVKPDILVIDEVLAVGDERFQRKCIDRIKSFQRDGHTILFVSHSPDQVRAICNRAVVLADGKMIAEGNPGESVRVFREHLLEAEKGLRSATGGDGGRERPLRIGQVSLTFATQDYRSYLLSGERLVVKVPFTAATDTKNVVFQVEVLNAEHNLIYKTDTEILGLKYDAQAGENRIDLHFESLPFFDGAYEVNVGILSEGVLQDFRDPAARFEVANPGRSTGAVNLDLKVALIENVRAESDGR